MAKSQFRQSRLPGLESVDEEPAAAPTVSVEAVAVETVAVEAVAFPPVESRATPSPESLEGKTVWVVDSYSLIFQVFHAIPEMTSPRGEPVAAVFGFTRDMLYLVEQKKPDYLFCAFDIGSTTFRHEMYSDYKVQRSEMPIDLVPQVPAIRRVLEALGVPQIGCESCEADDVLATIAYQTEQLGGECFLVSGDKDCRQLITDRVKVYNIRKNLMLDRAALEADWGIRPEQVIDYQAMVGDSVDNVPGIAGVGPKTARDLLQRFGTLEGILEHVAELPAGKRKQFEEGRDVALLSRELVRLRTDVPVAIDWEGARGTAYDHRKLLDLFAEYGFHSFAAKVSARAVQVQQAPTTAECHVVDTPQALAVLVQRLSGEKTLGMDVQTAGESPLRAEIVGHSFTLPGGASYYLPVRAPDGEPSLDPAAALEALRPVLEDPAIEKVGHDVKYDMVVLRAHGVRLRGVAFDSMLASYLLDAGERNHHLDELAGRYLNRSTHKLADLLGTGKKQKQVHEIPVTQLVPCTAQGSDLPLRLRPILTAQMAEAGLSELYNTVEIPLIEVLAELEFNGIRIDLAHLAQLSSEYGRRVDELEREVYALAGREFNIGSPKQLQEVLFVEQKLPVVKKTKTGASTDVDVLEDLARQHPLPAKIIEYRQYSKLKNTYVDALPQMVHPDTGRIHATFNQVVAATGRLSCNDPNLQNIPIRSQAGREIRSAFLPAPEWKLLAADYSQIELRVLAHFSGDPTLKAAFERDEDIHARVASQVYGLELDQVTSEMRRVAQAVNFGVIYGQTPFGLSKTIDIEQAEATQFIQAYFKSYPQIAEYLETILVEARKNRYVSTILGRRRAISGVRDRAAAKARDTGTYQRNLPERTAINTVIQGSAADLIKLAMIKIYERLVREQRTARMLLQIHDELVFEVPPEELAALGPLVAEEMATAVPLSVPIKVDLKVGATWAEC